MSADNDTLLDFAAIEKNLDSVVRVGRGVRPIPIAGIVGSLGRYQEFTENFLPQAGRVSEKFESVKAAMLSGKVLPPIKVYQVLDSFFVIDGHHRVTVAKSELKAVDIDAEVVEVEFGLSLSPEKRYAHDNQAARRFLIKVEERAFERETHLKNGILVRPLEVTELTSYAKLYEEIAHFRRCCAGGELAKKNVVFASLLWYESRFLPAARIILVRKFRKAKFYDLLPSLFQGIVGFIKQQRPTA